MSALAGFVRLDGAPAGQAQLQRMATAMAYLKTDSVDSWREGRAGFIHFKLATTPEAIDEIQPCVDKQAGLVALLDGRLDNRAELLLLLGSSIAIDARAGDAEILLQLFKQFGMECVSHLVGDYAIAVWNTRERRLFCARSPLGWRPFLWFADGSTFAFATEPRALLDGIGIPRTLNEGALGEFLSMRFVSQTETLWRGIYRLPPGSALVVEHGQVRSWHWHDEAYPESCDTEATAAERFLGLFDQGLSACMRSSGAIAAHLSGGLDSSSIFCRATELFRAGHLEQQVQALSVRFLGELHDEGEWINAVEAQTGIESTTIVPPQYSWDQARQWCAETLQLPLRPNVMGTCLASFEYLQGLGVRVLLTGEGGDDWLRGSNAHWPDQLRRGQLLQLWREAVHQGQGRYLGRLKRLLFESAGPLLSASHRDRLLRPHLQFAHAPPPWLRSQWASRIGLTERWRCDGAATNQPTFALQQRAARYTMARPHVNIDNVQSLAGCMGIELRHPFHDLRLTRYLMGVPGDLLLRNGERKYLLRQAMRGILPEKVRTRQSKGNLSSPYVDALEQMLTEVTTSELLCVQAGWVDGNAIARYFESNRAWYRAGLKGHPPTEPLGPVWSVVAADIWLKHAMHL